jgi:hypothetical protein
MRHMHVTYGRALPIYLHRLHHFHSSIDELFEARLHIPHINRYQPPD